MPNHPPHDIVSFDADLPPLHNPLCITAFKDRGGQTASAVVEYLIDAWDAQELAAIDPDAFFDFTENRPHARFDGDRRVIDWPTLRIHHARPTRADGQPLDRDLLFFHGPEPTFQWKALTEAVAAALQRMGVHDLLSLSTFPGASPHTRQIPHWMTTTDPALTEPFDVEVIEPRYQGPIGFSGALNALLRDSGLATASLIGITPFYLGVDANPPAGITLLETLARAWKLELDLSDAQREAETFLSGVVNLVERSERLQEVVAGLETQYDKNRTESQLPPTSPLPPSGELLADVEQFLRNQQTGDDSTTDFN